MLGNGRLEAQCFDGEKRLAHIRGKMRKKVRAVAALLCSSHLYSGSLMLRYCTRSGSIREILSYSRCEISKIIKPM